MRLDSQLSFIPLGAPVSLVQGTGVSIPSTNIIDLLGQGVGTAPQNIIGNATVFGADVGIGTWRPELEVAIGTAATTGTSATLNVQYQAAVDPGVGGNYTPTTWVTLNETGAIAVANLTANAVIARFPFLPALPPNLRPRFLRLNFQVAASTSFTAGTIAFALVTLIRDDLAQRYQPKNFVVA